MRVIDETTLRIYFPWVPEADLTYRLLPLRQNILLKPLFIFQDEAITHSPSYTYEVYTMLLG